MSQLIFKPIRKLLIVICTTSIFACTSYPHSVQLTPELSSSQSETQLASQLKWNIQSQDQRIAHYIIEIINGDNAATLINESQSSRINIHNALHNQWQEQGLTIASDSENKVDIQLIKLLAKVEQKSFSHNISSNIVIRVKLTSENRVFSKTFNSRATQEGAFSADSEQLTKKLNDQLSHLLQEIIQDSELNAKLQQL